MFYNTENVKLLNVRLETRHMTNMSSMYHSTNDYNLKQKDEHFTYRVCIINDNIEIIEPNALRYSWYDEFTNHINKVVTFYKFGIGGFSNTIYAYEIDGKKIYMNDQIINALIIPSMLLGSGCVMTYILANHIFKK